MKATADIWRDVYLERLNRDSETQILAPLGLTRETWLNSNGRLAPALVDRISQELMNFEIANTDVIFAGTDNTGAHIYVARNAHVKCQDAIGYAAVGSGALHARSQFIASSHSPASPTNRALFVTYAAKRRAEAAPGVGTDTDMFYSYSAGFGSGIRSEIVDLLKETYGKMEKSSAKIVEKTLGKVQDEITKITATPVAQPDQQQVPKDENHPAPADDKKAGGEEANVKKAE